jgi:hypothetical protein
MRERNGHRPNAAWQSLCSRTGQIGASHVIIGAIATSSPVESGESATVA